MEYKISKTWNTIDKYPKHGIQLIISKTWHAIDKYPKHGIQISKTWNTKYPKHGIQNIQNMEYFAVSQNK